MNKPILTLHLTSTDVTLFRVSLSGANLRTYPLNKETLAGISDMLAKGYLIVGWGARKTLNYLMRENFKYGVQSSWYYTERFGPRYRYADDKVIELRDFFTEYGVYWGGVDFDEILLSMGLHGLSLDIITHKVSADLLVGLRALYVAGGCSAQDHNTCISHIVATSDVGLSTESLLV